MPDIKILLFIGFIVYQIVAYISKQSAKSKQNNPAPAASIEEMIERMSEQAKPLKTAPKKRPVPIIASEVEEESVETRPVNRKYASYDNYEQKSPIFSKEDKKPFDEYVSLQKKNIYAEKIKNPQSFKEAFVINEILNPKYID